MKRIKLGPMTTVMGGQFRRPMRDKDENPIVEPVLDSVGNQVVGEKGNPQYRNVLEPVGKYPLLELLKSLYLYMPQDQLTRLDTIMGTKLFRSLDAATDGYLELDEDVHDWIKKKLQDDRVDREGKPIGVGVKIFGVNLHIIEEAVDNFERAKEKPGKED